jgi:hypothetical protein
LEDEVCARHLAGIEVEELAEKAKGRYNYVRRSSDLFVKLVKEVDDFRSTSNIPATTDNVDLDEDELLRETLDFTETEEQPEPEPERRVSLSLPTSSQETRANKDMSRTVISKSSETAMGLYVLKR